MAYRIREYKPKLKKNGSPVDTENESPAFAFDNANSDIHIVDSASWGNIIGTWVKSLLGFIVVASIILAILYVTLASTLMFITSIDGERAYVARSTFLGGVPDPNDLVVDSPTTPAGTDPISKVTVAFTGIPNVRVTQTITNQDNITITANGNVVAIPSTGQTFNGKLFGNDGKEVTGSINLKNQILAECVKGNCEKGSYVLISLNNIYGEYKQTITKDGNE